ncbi:unnamed protein product [Moneuplotes crassus]|uniref:Uncharacterized protein n=1 Tax=Euplotes crassus TaxID=5936 RepID=A0AAD1UJU6_EUPCR|nr:unnamed protein product [Moneuplotes crassus]
MNFQQNFHPDLCEINDPDYLYPGNIFFQVSRENFQIDFKDLSLACTDLPVCNREQSTLYSKLYEDSAFSDKGAEVSDKVLGNEDIKDDLVEIQDTAKENHTEEQKEASSHKEHCYQQKVIQKDTDEDNQNERNIEHIQEERQLSKTSSRDHNFEAMNFQRKDLTYKGGIRLLRRFYKKNFKDKNADIVRRRFRNCSLEDIFVRVQAMLVDLIPTEEITQELVYYTMGIIDLKKASELPCRKFIKTQITTFQNLRKKFSNKRFSRAIICKNLRTLACCLLQELDDPRVDIFREELISHNPASYEGQNSLDFELQRFQIIQ